MKIPVVIFSALALFVTGSAMSASAFANTRSLTHYTTRSVNVRYGDLDLSSQAGVATLYHRLRGAADEACGPEFHVHSLNPAANRQNWEACYKQALDKAAARVDNRRLSQVVYDHTESMPG